MAPSWTEAWSGYLAQVRERPNRVEAFPARPILAMIERYRGRTVCLDGVEPVCRVRDGAGREYAYVLRGDELVAVRFPKDMAAKLHDLPSSGGWEVVGKIAGTVGVFRKIGAQVRHHHALLVDAEGVASPGAQALVDVSGGLQLLPA